MFIAFLLIFLFFTIALLFVITSSFFGFIRTRVPFVPTATRDVEFIAKDLGITSKDIFYELGSGNGKVCFAVEKFSGAECTGYELTRWTHLWAKLKALLTGSKSKFLRKDFFKQDWSKPTVIYGYLYPPLMPRIKEKFLVECKPGSKAIMRDFYLPGLIPDKVYERPGNHQIYVYIRTDGK